MILLTMFLEAILMLCGFLKTISVVSSASQPPHIVVLLADDLGFNDVSWHNDIVISPNLEKMAREGIILDQHYSQPVCSPTRGAFLTGRYPIHTGLHNGLIPAKCPYGLDTSLTTLANEFKSLNYSTHAIGKWHLGFCKKAYWPTNRGFDHHFGYFTGMQDYFSHMTYGGYDFRDDEQVFIDNGTYSTNIFEQKAIDVIKAHDPDTPLFLYVPFQAVHSPLEVPAEYKELYSFIEDDKRQTLLGMVTAMDDAVGNILEALKETGLYDNSIILFMSDNGGNVRVGANNWPLRGQKGGLFEGGTRTDAFIHFPKLLEPREEQGIIHVSDWFPTLLSAAGASPSNEDLDGVNQWASLMNKNLPRPRQEMVYNIHYPRPHHKISGDTHTEADNPPVAAIRMGDWKYIWRETQDSGWHEPPEQADYPLPEMSEDPDEVRLVRNALFNLADDPLEKEDLSEVYPDRAKEMQDRLKEHMLNMSNVTYPEKTEAGDPSNFGGIWTSGWC